LDCLRVGDELLVLGATRVFLKREGFVADALDLIDA
jgi:hypothetical protein